jgi:uncharacterized protein
MPKHFVLGAAAIALLAAATPAAAFNCAVPALFSPSKKAVCASPALSSLDGREIVTRQQVLAKLGFPARPAVMASYNAFKATRDGCGSDARCLDATYRAQLRLYARLGHCATKSDRATCAIHTVDRHRQELHRSL